MDPASANALTFLIWFFGSFYVGIIANGRHRSYRSWILLSFLFSPLLTIIALALMPYGNETLDGFKRCPACAENVRKEATICRYCGTSLEPSAHAPGKTAAETASEPI